MRQKFFSISKKSVNKQKKKKRKNLFSNPMQSKTRENNIEN